MSLVWQPPKVFEMSVRLPRQCAHWLAMTERKAVFPVKHFRSLLSLLVLALLLTGCGSKDPEPYTYNVNNRTLNIYPESGTIVDGLDVYRYTRTEKDSGEIDYVITYPNGGRYNWTKTKNGGYGGGSGINDHLYLSGDVLIWALEAGEPARKVGSPILGIPLIVLGAWHALSPETVWYLKQGWMFRNAEPSDAAQFFIRFGGIGIAVMGLIACFV